MVSLRFNARTLPHLLFIINYLLSQNFIAAGSKKKTNLLVYEHATRTFLIKTLPAARRQFTTYTHSQIFSYLQQFTVLIFALGFWASETELRSKKWRCL